MIRIPVYITIALLLAATTVGATSRAGAQQVTPEQMRNAGFPVISPQRAINIFVHLPGANTHLVPDVGLGVDPDQVRCQLGYGVGLTETQMKSAPPGTLKTAYIDAATGEVWQAEWVSGPGDAGNPAKAPGPLKPIGIARARQIAHAWLARWYPDLFNYRFAEVEPGFEDYGPDSGDYDCRWYEVYGPYHAWVLEPLQMDMFIGRYSGVINNVSTPALLDPTSPNIPPPAISQQQAYRLALPYRIAHPNVCPLLVQPVLQRLEDGSFLLYYQMWQRRRPGATRPTYLGSISPYTGDVQPSAQRGSFGMHTTIGPPAPYRPFALLVGAHVGAHPCPWLRQRQGTLYLATGVLHTLGVELDLRGANATVTANGRCSTLPITRFLGQPSIQLRALAMALHWQLDWVAPTRTATLWRDAGTIQQAGNAIWQLKHTVPVKSSGLKVITVAP